MAELRHEDAICACGHPLHIPVVHSVNASRHPELREALLRGELHRAVCPACGRGVVVETELLYTDLDHDVFIGAFPPDDRGRADECVAIVEEAFLEAVGPTAPDAVTTWAGGVRRRVVFGLAALREKVLCFEHHVDDRVLEAWKAIVIALEPDYVAQGIEDLVLTGVDGDVLSLFAVDAAGTPRIAAHLRRGALDELGQQPVRELLPGLFSGAWVHHTGARPTSGDDPLTDDAQQ